MLSAECVQDLLREIRQEEPETCPVQDMLGKWKVIEKDLIPVLLSCEVRAWILPCLVSGASLRPMPARAPQYGLRLR